MKHYRGLFSKGFTLVELLVVIGIIVLLVALTLPAFRMARERARSVSCLNNLRNIGIGFSSYINNFGFYPPVRMHTAPNKRWALFLSEYVGGVVEDETRESAPDTDNMIINNIFRCPAIGNSLNQLEQKNRADYVRTGSYGYNWMTFGPFYPNSDFPRKYPVGEGRITRPQNTILVADAFGEASMTAGVHSYTLDPPTRLIGARWGTTGGGQCPADPRHDGHLCALFADGHAAMLTMRQAGYDSEDPRHVSGTGDPRLWNGVYDPNLTQF